MAPKNPSEVLSSPNLTIICTRLEKLFIRSGELPWYLHCLSNSPITFSHSKNILYSCAALKWEHYQPSKCLFKKTYSNLICIHQSITVPSMRLSCVKFWQVGKVCSSIACNVKQAHLVTQYPRNLTIMVSGITMALTTLYQPYPLVSGEAPLAISIGFVNDVKYTSIDFSIISIIVGMAAIALQAI